MARLAAVLFAVGIFLIVTPPASGHHTGVPCGPDSHPGRSVCLPYADSSFAVRTLQQTKALTYCFNSRAANYPNFRAQVRNVNDNQQAALGIEWREIGGVYQTSAAADAAGCQVWHSMPEVHGCTGCSAWVHYLNKPVLIEYKWQNGHTDWRTTIAHEQIHIYGLHEAYNDGAGIGCFRPVFGYWAHGIEHGQDPGSPTNAPTLMDCGIGSYIAGDWMTDFDVRYACENIDPLRSIFTGCGAQVVQTYPFWANGRWWFEDGWSFAPNSGCGEWFMPDQRRAWGECDPSWGGRWNPLAGIWTMPGSTYHPGSNTWWSGGLVLP